MSLVVSPFQIDRSIRSILGGFEHIRAVLATKTESLELGSLPIEFVVVWHLSRRHGEFETPAGSPQVDVLSHNHYLR